MDKTIIIAGLNYWRTQAPEALVGLDAEAGTERILKETEFEESEPVELLSKKFQVCLGEFFLVFKKAYRLSVYNEILSRALQSGYERAGARHGAGVDEFLKYVVARDQLIGLEAGGEKISGMEFAYWIKDMFSPLCQSGQITRADYTAISTNGYLHAKISYFLPDSHKWHAEMIMSPFDSDRTEWRIYRKDRPAFVLPKPNLLKELEAVA
ncbi:MAG: hypothetical protein HY513_00020 [Candidatus Aenigmarchaeota archaeon]|nr:hypothetical protein [Candidatus Aenigmarchaeota archaeon]